VLLMAFVRMLAFVLRLCANVARNLSRLLVRLYDVAIVVPLLVERLVKGRLVGAEGRTRRRMADVDVDIERTHA